MENCGRKKMANLNHAKIFFVNIYRYTENVFGICTDCSLFTLDNSFYLYGSSKFSQVQYFHVAICILFVLKHLISENILHIVRQHCMAQILMRKTMTNHIALGLEKLHK